MDKLKQILEFVRKHHFWMLCGLAALIGLIVWQMSTSKLEAEFQADKTKIDGYIQKVQSAARDDSQPRQHWKEVKDKETEGLKEDVDKAWHKLYDQQKQEV